MITMRNLDYLVYLQAHKNPLDKKYRWEVNTAFKKNVITDQQRVNLLRVKDRDLSDLILCIRNKVPVDRAQIGNYYFKRAIYLAKKQQRLAAKEILIFS